MEPKPSPTLIRKAFALFNEGGVGGKTQRKARLAVCEFITWEQIDSTNDLSAADLSAIVNTLEYWKHCGQIEYRCRRVADKMMQEVTPS